MKRFFPLCCVFFLTPALAPAQTAKIQAELQKELGQARTYEEIEILRRLLQRKAFLFLEDCRKCHLSEATGGSNRFWPTGEGGDMRVNFGPLGGGLAGGGSTGGNSVGGITGSWGSPGTGSALGSSLSGGGSGNTAAQFGVRTIRTSRSDSLLVEGCYVPGVGIVMQAQLPLSLTTLTAHPKSEPPPAVDEWEQVRKNLYGEKVDAAAASGQDPHRKAGHSMTIEDVLTQVLAENGKHLKSLGDKESVTIAVTFRGIDDGWLRSQLDGGQNFGPYVVEETGGNAFGGTPQRDAGSGSSGGAPSHPRSSSKDYELLADLHLKQGRYQEAIATLQKALELNSEPSRSPSLFRKLASALLLNDPKNSPQTLEKAAEFLKKAELGSPTSGKTAVSPRPEIPKRLIITAPRAALQNASSGNLDEFRRQITVTWLRFEHPVLGEVLERKSDPDKREK